MKQIVIFLSLVLLVGPALLLAERGATDSDHHTEEPFASEGSGVSPSISPRPVPNRPFSQHATSFGVSSLGAQFQFATNLNRRTNLRNGFDFLLWKKWNTYGGFTAPATVSLLSENLSLDFYPFDNHGLHFSPGILIHNPGVASAPVQLGPFMKDGTFVLNGHRYYSKFTPSSNPDPRAPAPGPEPPRTIQELQLPRTAFTFTTGWGNMISRKKTGPWSFPVEAGVAFLGSATVKTRWVQGQICDAQLQNCEDAATNPQLQSDLKAAFGSYKDHVDLLRTYPIISVGVAYHYPSTDRSHE